MSSNTEIKSETLVDQSYWDNSYVLVKPQIVPANDQLRLWLEKYVPNGNGLDCLEVGCYPARYLSVLGELGYTLHGVDLTPDVSTLKKYLSEKYRTGDFIHADFLKFNSEKKYDLVCSFGFIEHFTNWKEVLIKHADLVSPNGLIVIETPNFEGWFQQLIHKNFDNLNFLRHNIDSMRPDLWSEILEKQGFEIIRSEYFGAFEFWSDTKVHNLAQSLGLRLLSLLTPILRKISPGKRAYSPYCGIIAKRKS